MDARVEHPPQRSAIHPFPARFRLLLVDDDPRRLDELSRLLASRGCEVVTADGGRAAQDAIGRQQFDAILIDPGAYGREGLQAVAGRSANTPVIVVSGDGSVDAPIRALRGGAADFLRKPYQPEELLCRIDHALARRRLEKENQSILQRLQQSEKSHRFLVNRSPDLIYTLDRDGRFTFVSDRVESLLGYRRQDLLGQHYSRVVHEDDVARAEHRFNERRAGDRSSRSLEIRLRCNPGMRTLRRMNGHSRTVELSATGMYDDQAGPFERRFTGSYGVARDVTERKQAEETVHFQAYHDLLTGLPNRALFRDHLGLMLAQARRNPQPLAVLSLDLDDFKIVNESLGHTLGDELLRVVGTRLRQCLREGDTLARLGGDEFAVLLPALASHGDVEQICRKILQVLAKPAYVEGHEICVSVSIGACVAPQDGDQVDSLIRQAEIAMYQAKAHGRSQLQFWESGMQAPYSERLQLEADLRRALVRDEFVLFYQPQVDTVSGELRGFEALLRWWHPQRGLLSPGEFIPVAEASGVIVPIGDWVLRQAGAQIAEWRRSGLPPVRLSVNISARQLERADFVDSVMRALQAHALDASSIELEITESLLMRDLEANASKLGRLSAAGIRLAIDDFGTGYCSFKYLSRFPIHSLKIDQSFVQELEREENVSIVNAMIGMGRGMKLTVIAEGVETEAQRARLEQMQCHEVQGYYTSAPLSSQAATELLDRQAPALVADGRLAAAACRAASPR